MDLITVIVPVYNVQSYLAKCLESIVKQTYNNLQIILVDDGSPDDCPRICDEWAKKDKRIEVIHKINGGLSDARNVGLRNAKGSYICFVDSDDILDEHYIEWLYEAIYDNDAKMAVCDIECFNDGDLIKKSNIKPPYRIYSPEEALKQILQGTGIRAIACNKLYSSDILDGEKFVYGKHHEDEFFTYRIVDKADKIAFLPVPLYYYRQHPGSITATFSIKRLDALEAYLERLEFLKNKYPSLYKSEKVSFCVSCVSYNRVAQKIKSPERESIENKLIKLRKQIHFTSKELISYSLRNSLYIIGSRYFLHLYCCILNIFRGNNNE